MTGQPIKLTIEDIEDILTKDAKTPYFCVSRGGASGNWYPLAKQLLDAVRELDAAKATIEMLYDSRQEYINENERLHDALSLAANILYAENVSTDFIDETLHRNDGSHPKEYDEYVPTHDELRNKQSELDNSISARKHRR